MVPAPGRLQRRQRLAAQAVPRLRRVHPRVRRLHGAHHRAERPRRGRHRRAAEPERGAHRRAACSASSRPRPRPSPSSSSRRTRRRPPRRASPPGRRPGSSRPTTSATSPSPRRASSSGTRRATTSTNNPVMAMSYYPNEGNPLWEQYSTAAIIHTLNVYSRYTFAYPYPVAISVNGPVGGMEYPMICFNGPRPEEDGTYPARTKYGLISRRHPRGRAQLLPDDRQLRRAAVDVDGRRPQLVPAVPGRAGVGRQTTPRAAASRSNIVDYMLDAEPGARS